MTDIEDIAEAVVDIEDIVEEVADPEDLIEDFAENAMMVLFALLAGAMALVTVLLIVLTAVLAVVGIGALWVFVLLTTFAFVTTLLAVGAFIYVRTDLPSHLRKKIDSAREQADDTPRTDGAMTEEEAISELQDQYAKGNLDDHEMEQALDDAITSDDPERVVKEYT